MDSEIHVHIKDYSKQTLIDYTGAEEIGIIMPHGSPNFITRKA